MAHTIRLRVDPADADEYVIYADAGDWNGQRWFAQACPRWCAKTWSGSPA